MLEKIDHIGIAVESTDPVKKFFKDVFNLNPVLDETVEDQQVKVLGYQIGESKIEFVQPISPKSPVSNFLTKRGQGLHHICFQVSDIRKLLTDMKKNNIKLIDEEPKMGAEGKKIAFLHPKGFFGVLAELSQPDSE